MRNLTLALPLAVLVGCGGSDELPVAAPQLATCESLAQLAIAPTKFSLPTSGATINSAAIVKTGDAGNIGGEYCKVIGSIRPVDQAAPSINFQVNLPSVWNGKALQLGGGGYNGNVPNTTGQAAHGMPTLPTPLAQGYMTLASDSGHQAADSNDASFALNEESLANYGGQHIKKTRDAAAALAELRYGSAIRKMYYIGGSTGGREALTAAMKWPEAYDGVVSHYPTANFLGLRLWGAALARTIYDNNSAGWIPPALVTKIAVDSLATCDGLDGVTDGLVSNMPACRMRSAELLEKLTCKNGETGYPAGCLTAAQLKTIDVYHHGYAIPYTFANDINRYAGYNSLEGITMQVGSQAAYIEPPPSGPNAHHVNRADQFAKYFLTKNPKFNLLSLDIQSPGAWLDRIKALSATIDATNPDLTAFRNKGGKVLMVQGHDDPSVSPYANTALYQSIVSRMGATSTDSFMRFYLVPGLAHGDGKFRLAWDGLGTLDAWVDRAQAPGGLVGVDVNAATNGRSRPMCAFPTWPKYRGSGSADAAVNYTCVNEAATQTAASHLPLTQRSGVFTDGQRWQLTVPANWNGTVVNDLDRIGSNRANYFLPNGFAYTGTARHPDRDVNWNPRAESDNMVKVLDLFQAEFGKGRRTLQFGCSGGGSVALSVAEDHPSRFDGVIPMHATSPLTLANMRLDLVFALRALLDPNGSLPLIVSKEPTAAAETAWINALNAAQQSPLGRARMALAGVLAQYPAWGSQYAPAPAKPDPRDAAAVQQALLRAVVDGTRRSITARPQWDQPAGVMSWNVGVDYRRFYTNADPAHRQIVRDMYAQAGLAEQEIEAELGRVNAAPRISAEPRAVDYWRARTHSGVIGIPMLHVHGIGDAGTPAANVSSYEQSVKRAGRQDLYRQAFINAAGHCTFNDTEMATLVGTMVRRLDAGDWGTLTAPDALNAFGRSLGLGEPRFIQPGVEAGWSVPTQLNRAFFPDSPYP